MKPTTINHQGRNGYEREYVGQIDFRECLRDTYQVLTVVPANPDYQDKISQAMFKHGIYASFDIELDTLSTKRFLTISYKPFGRGRTPRRDLLRMLDKLNLPIIWKECRHGYQISPDGRILRKWALQPNVTP